MPISLSMFGASVGVFPLLSLYAYFSMGVFPLSNVFFRGSGIFLWLRGVNVGIARVRGCEKNFKWELWGGKAFII